MSKFLKGNYSVPGGSGGDEPAEQETSASAEFERRALERLGGSIAFVMKKNTFVWSGEKSGSDPEKTKS